MAINWTNWLNAPLSTTHYSELLPAALEGYQAARMPKRIAQEEAQRELANRLAEMQNEYYPKIQEQGLELGRENIIGQQISNKYNPLLNESTLRNQELLQQHQALTNAIVEKTGLPMAQADLLAKQMQAKKAELENSIFAQTGLEQAQAKIEHEKAQARAAGLTSDQRELADIYGYGTPAYYNALARKQGIDLETASGKKAIPDGAISLAGTGINNINRVAKEQSEEVKRINQSLIPTMNDLEKAWEIIEKNPNLSDKLAAIIINPGDKSIVSKALRSMVNKKDREALEKLDKAFSNVVLNMGSGMGAKAFTDMKAALIERAKGSTLNTNEANKFVIRGLMEMIYPEIEYGNDLKKVMGKYELPFYRENYPQLPLKYMTTQQLQQLRAQLAENKQ